ncbi:MAG: neutral/alkaline non-lysosomal ceramidase N-terminal domain-containing protein [Caldilineaceae bacterium]|nr:neutral/alkaline non-lysosomal ceramidase N-terminal domain-containing protein [Caldilineaceae bacterium]
MDSSQLRVGFGETDITPPHGLYMCGSLDPRRNDGTTDPLQSHALVAESGGRRIAIVGVDLIGLPKELADKIIAEAAGRTGIAPDNILIASSHTHSGPYTAEGLYSFQVTDAEYLSTLPERIGASVEEAVGRVEPVTMYIGRSLVHHGIHNRRVICPDGKVLNTWMPQALNDLKLIPQVLGTAGPVDPELWVLRFDRLDGSTLGVFYNFSLHTNSKGGVTWSADYPCVVAEHMREAYGPEVVSVYTPGACADINVTLGGARWRESAAYFAEQAVDAARRAIPVEGPIAVSAIRRDITVPRRDPADQPPEAVGRLNWGGEGGRADVFDRQAEFVASMPEQLTVVVGAARIGPFAIASNPGELFVEYGLTIKRRSPFPHTVVSELTNDLIMYQPTRQAFAHQGYETLVGPNRVAMEGIEQIVDTAVELVEELWNERQVP